jgi:hypothetical protein
MGASATGDIRSCWGVRCSASSGVPCPEAACSRTAWPGCPCALDDRPTGRIAASLRPSADSWSPTGVGGSLRGVNQPPPSLPPEIPLSADVVVGASMVCLASNIFRSVCAPPRSEDACFPPQPLCFPSDSVLDSPNAAHVEADAHRVRTCEARVRHSPRRPLRASQSGSTPGRITENAGFRSSRPVTLLWPALPFTRTTHDVTASRPTRTGVERPGSSSRHRRPLPSGRKTGRPARRILNHRVRHAN